MNILKLKMKIYFSRISKTLFFLSILLIGTIECQRNPEKEEAKTEFQPNILWIVADDLGTDLGCYGDSLIYTPNLDKLATEKVKYNHFYTVTAVFSPSQSNMITGMYLTSINCHQHRTRYKNPLPDGIYLVTKYFKNAGYFNSTGSLNLNVYYQFNYEPKKDSVS